MQWWVSQASSPGLAHSKCGVHLYCRKDAKAESSMGPLPCSPLFALSEIVHRLKYPWPHGIDFASCLKPEKAMAAHSSTLAWKIPWTEAPGRLQSMGWLGVSLDWATSLSRFTFLHWRRKWQPAPVFLPGGSQGQGSLVGCRLWGRTVGHDWSDLAAAAAACLKLGKKRSHCTWRDICLRFLQMSPRQNTPVCLTVTQRFSADCRRAQ